MYEPHTPEVPWYGASYMGDVIEIRNGITFHFYTGLPLMPR